MKGSASLGDPLDNDRRESINGNRDNAVVAARGVDAFSVHIGQIYLHKSIDGKIHK